MKKTVNNCLGDFSDIKIGTKFVTLSEHEYIDNFFPKGSVVTFLGTTTREKTNYIDTIPRFQFDSDSHHTQRMLSRNDIKEL